MRTTLYARSDHFAIERTVTAEELADDWWTWARGVALGYARATRLSALDRDELEQASAIGLWNATRRFNPLRGVPFKKYARHQIVFAIRDEVRSERGHQREYEVLSEEMKFDVHNDPAALSETEELKRNLLASIEQPQQRVALRVLISGHGSKKVAEELQVTRCWAQKRMKEARMHASEFLRDRSNISAIPASQGLC